MLRTKTITLFTQGNMVVLAESDESELKVGDRVIISEVIPVMQGTPLKPIPTTEFEKKFRLNALGDSSTGDSSMDDLSMANPVAGSH